LGKLGRMHCTVPGKGELGSAMERGMKGEEGIIYIHTINTSSLCSFILFKINTKSLAIWLNNADCIHFLGCESFNVTHVIVSCGVLP
jgi:hypothetical protein